MSEQDDGWYVAAQVLPPAWELVDLWIVSPGYEPGIRRTGYAVNDAGEWVGSHAIRKHERVTHWRYPPAPPMRARDSAPGALEHFIGTLAQFLAGQEPLGPEFTKVWDDNTEALYQT